MHDVCANSNPFRADEAGESLPDGKHAPKERRRSASFFTVRKVPERVNQLQTPTTNSLT
jgi:hypothetical protein